MSQGGESPARAGVTGRAEVRACQEGVGPLAYRGYVTTHEPAGVRGAMPRSRWSRERWPRSDRLLLPVRVREWLSPHELMSSALAEGCWCAHTSLKLLAPAGCEGAEGGGRGEDKGEGGGESGGEGEGEGGGEGGGEGVGEGGEVRVER